MKKNLFYLFALICSMSLFTACSDDEDEPQKPWSGKYGLAEYTTVNTDDKANVPVTSALYAKWIAPKGNGQNDDFCELMNGVFAYMGGAVLPQVLGSINLSNDGNILADYVPTPNVVFDASDIMGIAMMGADFPTVDKVTANHATGGFTTSPKDLAYWSATDSKFTLKLNLTGIMTQVLGKDASTLVPVVEQLLDSEPAAIKGMLTTLLGVNLNDVSDVTINQLKGWIKNGIPMNIKTGENGHIYIYLDKTAFDNFFAVHAVSGSESASTDLMIIWNALSEAGMIPEEAQMASMMIFIFTDYWSNTTTFDIGLELVKK